MPAQPVPPSPLPPQCCTHEQDPCFARPYLLPAAAPARHRRRQAGDDRRRFERKGNDSILDNGGVNAIDGDFWVRLLYTHPYHWTDELIATIAACPKICRYVDMPLQHINDTVLKRMKRETDGRYIRDLVGRLVRPDA